jgi:hypothetical protein
MIDRPRSGPPIGRAGSPVDAPHAGPGLDAPSPEKGLGNAGAAGPGAYFGLAFGGAAIPDDRHHGANLLSRHVAEVRRQHERRAGWHWS